MCVLYLLVPQTFTSPQFWARTALSFIRPTTKAGAAFCCRSRATLCTLQRLAALVAQLFSPTLGPAIYDYTAFTLLIVWLATSPRFDMPLRPLLGIAVVVVPRGYEVLGNVTNLQWILPVGAFILLFMRPARSAIVLAGESIFLAIVAVTGPFLDLPRALVCRAIGRDPA